MDSLRFLSQKRLKIIRLKFFDFFANFELNRSQEFSYNNQIIIKGLKGKTLEKFKLEQLAWITEINLDKYNINPYVFVKECKKRILFFLDFLGENVNGNTDLNQIFKDGHKVTIQSSLKPKTVTFESDLKEVIPLRHSYTAALLLSLVKTS